MNQLTVGIITYNSSKYIKELLESIFKSSLIPSKVIIVDNNSSDETIDIISSIKKGNIKLINKKENIGHSKACNILMKESTTRFLIIQDHDTVVLSNTYEELYKQVTNLKVDEVALTASIKQTSKYSGKMTFGSDLHYLVSSLPRFSFTSEYVNICPTTCVIIDLSKINKIEFDNDMFIYQNDFDFFYRLRLNGYKLKVASNAVVIHKEGTSSVSGRNNQVYSKVRTYNMVKNWKIFILKNYSFLTILVLLPVLLLYELLSIVFYFIKGTFVSYLRGTFDFVHIIPEVLKKRKEVLSKKVVNDFLIIDSGKMGISQSAKSGKIFELIISFFNTIFNIYFIIVKKIILRFKK